MDETAMSSADAAEVAAMKTTSRTAMAPLFPISVTAAAGATRPAIRFVSTESESRGRVVL